jgi:tetratricopeptide (TPR) repeat protein
MGRPLTLALACVLARTVAAQPADPEAEAEAKLLYQDGVTHYDLAEYDDAIEKFRAAYHLSRQPRLLFNIAQAYRLKGAGSCRNAVHFYRTYLRLVPAAENRAAVEDWLAKLAACADAEPPSTPPAVDPPDGTEIQTPPPPPPPPLRLHSEAHASRVLPWSLVAGGAAMAAAGGGMLLWVSHDLDDARTGCRPECNAIRSRLELRANVGYALLGVGGALAIAGGVVFWRTGRSHERSAYVAPAPGGIVVGGAF